jgi:DNA-binding NarL/FixJ family response regulator
MTDAPAPFRVLLADDEEIILHSLSELLKESGFDVVGAAADGREAVSMAERLHPDVVVADLRMPGLTGLEVATALRESRPEVPVIILSAYDDVGLQLAAERIPVAAYLVKGCSSREIFAAIRNAAMSAVPAAPAPWAGL